MKDKNVKTNFYIADDASYDLIEKHLPVLEKRLAQKGYRCSITMSKEEKRLNLWKISCSGTCHRQERFTDIRLMCVHRQRRRQICGLMEKQRTGEKQKTAVAVAYEPGDAAPKILAAGKGEVAERIIEKAKENDVPFYQDNKLAETLSKLQIGDTIPPELYDVVAEILVFVDDMDKMKAKLSRAGLL